MNKTRMGKRAASLLLSLVMMLSLLPTAAYAAMADGVETQGAIVSENGTDVSDDSNSSGNTGGLQVGDSKDSDGTGDQQVEGSSGSGTADDTTGTEGGADPTDSVNGNDSADPQDDGDAVLPAAANVAKVGDTEYATLEAAIAALSSSSYTLELLDESVWEAATPVYWAAGSESGYAATLADALTAAYMANAGGITIVCRPGEDVGKLTHGHVADDITIYGNNAYISSGECDLEVDTYTFSRDTGKQVTSGGAYLEKDITITAYELDNLGVWGERHTSHKVTVDLTDCDSTDGITVQRVYISGTTGVNDITLTGCDFGTKATSVYSNADGAVVIDNCSFTGAQVPVNFNHKANGTQTVAVQNSTFTNCGDNGDWEQFAAPVRFVNSGSGTMTTTVATCTFTGTVGSNGDILLGDGREGQKSNDVALTVESTEATVQAQQPGYYGSNGTTDASKQGTKNVAAGDKLTTSVTQLMPSETTTSVAEVNGVKYDSLQAAIDAAAQNATVTLLADTRENVTIETYGLTLDLSGHTLNGGTEKGKPALTVMARVTVKDSSAAKTGTIMREDTAENSGVSSHYVIDIQDGWLFFESGSVTNNSGVVGVKGASLVRVGDDSVAKYPGLTISGGTFTQDNFIVIKVDRGTFYLKEDGTLNSKNSYAVENWKFAEIKGGTVNGTVAAWTYSGGHNSDLTISGGTVNGNVLSVNYGSAEGKVAKVSITGGTVNGALDTRSYDPSTNALTSIDDATKATIEVTGGTFSNDPTKYVVEDSGVTKNTDGTYGVAKAYLAKVGDTSYYTMDEAFKAQTTSGEAIVLLRDYTTGSTFNSGSINRTVDLDGHTWTCTGTDANSAAFEINYSDVTLTVKNGKVVSSQLVGLIPSAMGGTIKYDNSSLEFDGVVMTTTAHSGIETNGNNTNDTVKLVNSELNVPNGFGIYFPSSGTLTIDNSVINAKTMGVQVCAGSLNISGAGTAITVSGDGIDKTINDGAIEDGAAISIVNRIGYKGLDEIKVEGGTFTANGTNAAVKAYDWDNTNKTESDFTQAAKVSVSGGTFSSEVDKSLCAKGYIPTQNTDGTYSVKEGKYVAEIGSQGYESLTEAVAAAEDGQTVRLLADVAESSIKVNANITIDLNKMTVTGSFVTYGEVTIQNGTIDVPDGETNYAYGKLTLADVDITGKAASSSLLSVNYNGSVTIDKDSTIVADSAKGDDPAVFIKGQNDSGKTYAPELNIYGTVQSAKTPAIQGNGTDRGVSHVNVFEGAVVKSESLAVYLPQPCEVNITGGLVEGYCGIGIKSGTLNISGGTVRGVANDNVIGDQYSQTNGISYDGSAIMIDSYIGYAGQVQINISGNAVVESKYSTAIREIGNDKSQTNLVGLDITGGTVLGAKDTDAVLVRDVTAKDVNISGGEFSSIVKKEYCAPGFTPVTANSEGRYGVEVGKFTVMVTSRTTGSDSPVANVAGGGSDITYAQGTKVTASAISGYKFVGWFVNEYPGTPYSTDLTCEVKPTDDWTMIAVYEPISGGKFWLNVTASEFTVNGGAVQDSYLYEQFAIGTSVTVEFTGTENFLYWVNASNKVVSTDKSYTFIMGSETTLKAVNGKARQNQATVVFISHSDQIISSKAYTTNDTIQFPVPPIKMGCTFTGWSMTESQIRAAMANNSGIIQVRALYTEPSIACKVTVVYPEGVGNVVVNAVVGKAINVTAKDIEGKTFSYWTDNDGNVLGYTKTLKLAPSGDMTVKAVYDEAAEAKPVITISEVSATTANESYVVTFMATRAVPDGYKVVKQGILWSRDAVCGEDGAAAYMQFDSNGKLPTGVNAYIGNSLELNGVTRLDITTKYNDRTFYGRGYMVLESDAGELLYIYTNTIESGSYDSLTK